MVYVYAIKSLSANYIYVGMTTALERRLHEHNTSQNRSTKAYCPFVLVYVEELENRAQARKREKYFKSGVGKEYLKGLLK